MIQKINHGDTISAGFRRLKKSLSPKILNPGAERSYGSYKNYKLEDSKSTFTVKKTGGF